jgi:hypothetical protein
MQTRYSWLHEERAKVMRDMYGRILETEDKIEDFLHSWGRLPGQGGPLSRWTVAQQSWQSFFDLYRPQKLLFSKEVADKFDDLNRWFVLVLNAYQRHLVTENGDEYTALGKMLQEDLPGMPDHRSSLESEFRRLYGTLDE